MGDVDDCGEIAKKIKLMQLRGIKCVGHKNRSQRFAGLLMDRVLFDDTFEIFTLDFVRATCYLQLPTARSGETPRMVESARS